MKMDEVRYFLVNKERIDLFISFEYHSFYEFKNAIQVLNFDGASNESKDLALDIMDKFITDLNKMLK